MNKTKSICLSLIFALFTILMLQSQVVIGQDGPFAEIKAKMTSLSEAEQESLQTLFVAMQQIEEMEKAEERMTHDILLKNLEIQALKEIIAEEEIAYTKKMEDLKQVLKSYQRMGTGTYLEIILDSDSLAMLLRRINLLRDLTRNTGRLMELLEESKVTLLGKQTNLAEMIRLMEDNQQQLRKSLTKKQQLREEQENYLRSLQDKREDYQKSLVDLQQNWHELKESVPGIIQELASIIDEGNIPMDKIKISFNRLTVTGAIDEETINDLISGRPLLPEIEFSFYPGRVEISIPDKNLVLAGLFVIQETHTIKFQVKEGSFYGMPLDPGAIDDLFVKGELKFSLKLPLEDYTLNSIQTREGLLELSITL